MTTSFRVGVCTLPNILGAPPPQFQHLGLLYTPFAVRLGETAFPAEGWCDFAGVWLFRWCRAVWELSAGKARGVRLPFWYNYEVWLRRTRGQWWRVSLVENLPEARAITGEGLVLPEQAEAALLTAVRRLVAGARSAGRRTEDAEALAAFLDDPEGYLNGLERGSIPPPSFLSGTLNLPSPFR